MKIVKRALKESKRLVEADDVLDPVNLNQSTDNIADELKKQIAVADGGEAIPTDAAAEQTAADAQQLGDKINADQAVVAPDEGLEVENAITRTLDAALKQSIKLRRKHSNNRANVLIIGLPGSSKTASVYDWAKSAVTYNDSDAAGKITGRKSDKEVQKDKNGNLTNATKVNIVYINAKNNDLDAWMNGYTTIDPDQKLHVANAISDNLAELEKPNSILFIDEYNRQTKQNIRASLYTLINEHYVTGNAKVNPNDVGGRHYFNNFLFTIACMNPYLGKTADEGAGQLNSAEYGRFIHILDHMDSTKEACTAYIEKQWNKYALDILHESKPNFNDLYHVLLTKYVGINLVDDPDFEFDDVDHARLCATQQRNLLSQRVITTALDIFEDDIDDWIDWLNGSSRLPLANGDTKGSSSALLDEDAQMIEEILTAMKDKLPNKKDLFNDNQDLFDKAGVQNPFASGAAPQANGQPGSDAAAAGEAEMTDDEERVAKSEEAMWSQQPTTSNGAPNLSHNATRTKIQGLMNNW